MKPWARSMRSAKSARLGRRAEVPRSGIEHIEHHCPFPPLGSRNRCSGGSWWARMNTATVKSLGNSVLLGGTLHPLCFASGRLGVSAHPLWHPPRPNPSVKGTNCGEPQFAPYLERSSAKP